MKREMRCGIVRIKKILTISKKSVDKLNRLCYYIIRKRKEIKTMMYIRSILTGQVYEVECLPKFGGYEVVTKATYIEWLRKMGL